MSGTDDPNMPRVHRALVALGKDFWLGNGGDPQNEQEWMASYQEVINEYGECSPNQARWTVTWAEIEAKMNEMGI